MFTSIGRVLRRLMRGTNPNAVPLPPELISRILSYLPPESVVSFALTCRRFHPYMPSPPPTTLSGQARQALLVWLEPENPRLYFCHPCNDLHTWQCVPDRYHRLTQYDRYCRDRRNPWYYFAGLPGIDSYQMNLALARLVMNRHLSHGILSVQSWTARIIGDELYLKASIVLYHHRGCARTLRQFLDNPNTELKKSVCHHIRLPAVGDRPVGSGPCPILGLDEEPRSADLFVPATGTITSCRHCFTDYRVDIRWLPFDSSSSGPKGWVAGVTRWYQLGGCRSPDDHKWHNYVTSSALEILESRIRSCEAGMVYQNWRTLDDDDAAAAGLAGEEADQLAKASFASLRAPA